MGKKQGKSGQQEKVVQKPQSGDARKEINVNDLQDDSVLSWSWEEEHSNASIDVEAS